jgi:hypothetical protein
LSDKKYMGNMATSIVVGQKRGRGRLATGQVPRVTLRMTDESREAVEEWAANQEDEPKLSEAIRRLVDIGLAAAAKRRRGT